MVGSGWRCHGAAADDSARGVTLYPAGGALGGAKLSEPRDAKVDRSWKRLEWEDEDDGIDLMWMFLEVLILLN